MKSPWPKRAMRRGGGEVSGIGKDAVGVSKPGYEEGKAGGGRKKTTTSRDRAVSSLRATWERA